jgi:hypothetical protein
MKAATTEPVILHRICFTETVIEEMPGSFIRRLKLYQSVRILSKRFCIFPIDSGSNINKQNDIGHNVTYYLYYVP